jgi:hypothetical protein
LNHNTVKHTSYDNLELQGKKDIYFLEKYMVILKDLDKHLLQIKNGGFITVVKKLKTLIFFIFQRQ